MIFFIRSSNSPRYFVPATNAPISSIIKRLFCISSGTSPLMIFWASPSAIAVLPTPGSPTNTGLFLVRRLRIWISRLTSLARPTTGSKRLSLANLVKSLANESRVGVPCGCAFPWAGRRRPAAPFLVSLKPIFFFNNCRILAKLKPKFSMIRDARMSSSRNSPSNKCSVPICGAPNRLASSPAKAKVCFARGE